MFESPNPTPLDFCLSNLEVDTRDELLACILDAAAHIKKREDQLKISTRNLRTRFAKCTEVDGGIFEHLL
jgi:hypothetical protein